MSKSVPCAGIFNDYLDADGPDGADGPEECDQPPSASAKRNRPSLPKSASSLLSAGPSTASLQGPSPPGPAGGGQSQGHDPMGKTTTGMDVWKMTWLAAGLGLSGAISYAESTMPTRTALARRRAYKYMAALQEENDTH
jgi:hypothetical protein